MNRDRNCVHGLEAVTRGARFERAERRALVDRSRQPHRSIAPAEIRGCKACAGRDRPGPNHDRVAPCRSRMIDVRRPPEKSIERQADRAGPTESGLDHGCKAQPRQPFGYSSTSTTALALAPTRA